MKTCFTCKTEKSGAEFYKRKTASDGLDSNCKQCTEARKAKKRRDNPSAKAQRKAYWASGLATSKPCKTCKRVKALDEFVPNATMFSGCENECLDCRLAGVVKWQGANRDKHRGYVRKCNKAHPVRVARASKKYKSENRPKMNAYNLAYQKAHPAQSNKRNARHRAEKLRATPAWANEFYISEIYDLCTRRTRCTGVEHEVDHRVPLRSKLVCGLHWEHNLQVIPAPVNASKGNRHWPDMPDVRM